VKILFFANTDWYLFNFRLSFAQFLRSRGHEVVMTSPPGPYGEQLTAAGFRWLPLRMGRRSLSPLREVDVLTQLIRLYRLERPDLAHHFTIKCVIYGTLAARLANVPSVVNAIAGLGHVFISNTPRARMLRPAVRGLLELSCVGKGVHVVVQNADDLRAFQRMRLPSSGSVTLIRGSGVDVRKFKPIQAAKHAGEPAVVLFIGRLLYEKGIEEFVAMARRVRAARPGRVRFVAAGDIDPGNPASVGPSTLSDWRAAGDVEFPGHVTDIPALLAEADIVVLPSYGEGAPRSLIEAAASGKPLIATDVRGCREVVRPDINGLLVPLRNVDALAAAVARLVDDPDLRARMGEAGRQLVLRELDEQIVFARTYAIYEGLWENQGREWTTTSSARNGSRKMP
jgi:glycosyltransferase involved in cell wall biosynthesis